MPNNQVFGRSVGGGLSYVIPQSINQYSIYFLESLFSIAVNLFIAISGYFMVNNQKRNVWRVFELLFQVVLFNVITYVVRCGIGSYSFSTKSFIGNFLPVNYYAILYCTMYLISPYLNMVVNGLLKKELKRLVCLFVILFSILPTGVDLLIEITGNCLNGLSPIGMYGSQYGYSIVNFMLMYLLGACICKFDLSQRIRINWLVFGILIIGFLLTIWAIINDYTGFGIERSAWEYCNPIVILEACLTLLVFLKLKIRRIRIINSLSKATFTVYLLHIYLFKLFDFKKIINQNAFVMCMEIITISVGIYIVCWVCDLIYKNTIIKLLNKIEKKIPLSYEVGADNNI